MDLEKLVPSTYKKVVAVEHADDQHIIIYQRDNDSVSSTVIPFQPFVLLKEPTLLMPEANPPFPTAISPLSGNGFYKAIATFEGVKAYKDTLKFLKQKTGASPSAPFAPYKVISDLIQQACMTHSIRLFRDMTFNELRRLQFDIETFTEYDFPNAGRPEDKIIIITLSDSTGWEEVLSLDTFPSEKEMLSRFVEIIQERDPDVLEGHNICRFDLPFIETKAKMYKVPLKLGRDNSTIKKRNSRFSVAERRINYTRYDCFGRHIVDTLHLVQFYDVIHRELDGYGLKNVAKHFNVSPENRVYVDGDDIPKLWNNDREKLLAYALDDVRETNAISKILSPSFFYQTQLIPLSFQNCIIRGNATRIESILIADYLSTNTSIPLPEQGSNFGGGLTKALATGVFENVWHCDVRSLYPSILLAYKWAPKRDEKGTFLRFLDELRTFRFTAKDAEKNAKTPDEKDFYNALQTTFKILINSFYGYLGFSMGSFNDYEVAGKITEKGREILTSMLDYLNSIGATVIEMDTDGIYFTPPKSITSTEEMEKNVQSILPDGIDIELDATYKRMFCYKSKNYALLSEDGTISLTGAALKSRGLEPFQRDYIRTIIQKFLLGKSNEIPAYTEELKKQILNRELPLKSFSKTENLSNSLETYRKKMASGKGRRSAAYELALKSERNYLQGDQVIFYVTGDKKKVSVVDNSCLLADAPEERNENVNYYAAKIDELYKKFAEFIEKEDDNNYGDLLALEF